MNPCADVVRTIRVILEGLIKALGFGMGDQQLLTEMAVYFSIVGTLLAVARLFWEAYKGTAEDSTPKLMVLARAVRASGMRLALVPLIAFAPAIPLFIREMTPGAFAPIAKVSESVAQLGDSLLTALVKANFMFGSSRLQANLDAAKGIAAPEGQMVEWQGSKGEAFKALASTHETAHQAYLDAVAKERSVEKAVATAGGSSTGLTKSLKKDLDQVRQLREKAAKAFGTIQEKVNVHLDQGLEEMRKAKTPSEIQSAETKSMFAAVGAKLAPVLPGLGGPIVGWAAGKAQDSYAERAKELRSGKADALDDRWLPEKIWDFLTHIGFWACALPAVIGILAGTVIAVKEAVGLLQYGAKLEVLRNIGFGIASIFAPLFMLAFMWEKTEQFGWKFLSFLFSMYFGYFVLSYVAGVVGTVGVGYLRSMLDTLTVIPIQTYTQEASWELFMGCCAIGLKGMGAGMVAAFVLDIIKSAMSLGTGFVGGTFSAS